MGKRGPAPTPTATLKLRGSWRANTRKNEPRPEPKIPNAPTWLDAEGKREWKRIAALLEPLRYVSETDRAMLAAYCQSWSDYVAAVKMVDMKAVDSAFARLLRASSQFGLTPATRAQCNSMKKDNKDVGRVGFTKTG